MVLCQRFSSQEPPPQGGGELSMGDKQGILAWERTRSNNSMNLLVLFDISFFAQHISYTNFMLCLQ